MKIGVRKPSFKKSLKARTTGKLKKTLKKSVIPEYGKKGMGLITNPKKSLYNRVYNKTSFSIGELFSTKKNGSNSSGLMTILLYFLFFPFILIYWIIKLYIVIIKYCYLGIKKIINKNNGKSLILLLSISLFVTGCDFIVVEDNNPKENNTIVETEESKLETEKEHNDKIGIWSDEYKNLVNEILKKSTENNKYLKYTKLTLHNPYIQVNIQPTNKYKKTIIEQEAKKITEYIVKELQKYEYDEGGFWRNRYEYINIYFHDYDSYGKLNRNGGPFVQIRIMDIKNITVDDIFDKM